MGLLKRLIFMSLLAFGIAAPLAASAGANDPLFINLTTDDSHRVTMALSFGSNQLQRGHPLTVFLNDRAVLVASKASAEKFTEQHRTMQELLTKGAAILVCPLCMKHHGVNETDLLAGLVLGNPERTGDALFQTNAKTMTW